VIKLVRAFADSEGNMHATREAACMAEFRRLLWNTDMVKVLDAEGFDLPVEVVTLHTLIEHMFEIDRLFGEACREDSRADISLKGETDAAPDAT
jgi:hypothetical protein